MSDTNNDKESHQSESHNTMSNEKTSTRKESKSKSTNDSTSEFTKSELKSREILYRLIISQLFYDGYQHIAVGLSGSVQVKNKKFISYMILVLLNLFTRQHLHVLRLIVYYTWLNWAFNKKL